MTDNLHRTVPGRTPNYILSEPVSFAHGAYDVKTMAAGTFVRPIEYHYVPKHVKEDERWKHFDKLTEVFCHCSYGTVPVPRKSIRVAE